MLAGPGSVRLCANAWCYAVLVALLSISYASNAADNFPLRPPDTSSPRATLQGFIQATDDIYRHLAVALEGMPESDRLLPKCRGTASVADALGDASKGFAVPRPERCGAGAAKHRPAERLLQLKEILDRIEVPVFADIPDRDVMAQVSPKRWRLPNTEIDIGVIGKGPVRASIWCPRRRSIACPEF
jgi:MscS family membrane protein